MATFAQFVRVPRSPRVAWVCGVSPVLVAAVVDRLVVRAGADPVMDIVRVDVGADSPAQIWAAVDQYPSEPGAARVIVVSNAQMLTDYEPLTGFLANSRRLPGTRVVFVADSPGFPRDHDGALTPVMDMIRSRGVIVAVKDTLSERAAYVRDRESGISDHVVAALVASDPAVIKDTLDIHAALGIVPTVASVNALARPGAQTDYVTALVERRIPDALAAAGSVPGPTVPGLLRRVSQILAHLEVMYPLVLANAPVWQAISRGVPEPVARAYWSSVKHYDRHTAARARAALVSASNVGRFGPLEVLAGLW